MFLAGVWDECVVAVKKEVFGSLHRLWWLAKEGLQVGSGAAADYIGSFWTLASRKGCGRVLVWGVVQEERLPRLC